jgi:predicted MFS family arabinose efflux permease
MYWPIAFAGYAVQVLAVPLLALAAWWPVAAVLILAERSGRAMRNPPRDAMLAHASSELGSGWAFGLREALDAGGAMVGPLIVAGTVYLWRSYRPGFAVLVVPALLTLLVLLGAWRQYPHPHRLELREPAADRRGIPPVFWVYLGGMALIAGAYADFPLMAYHLGKTGVVAPAWIPVLYAVAMATEAVGALGLGRLFDRVGLLTVVGTTALTAWFAPLVFLGGPPLVAAGMVLWGLGIAAQESIVKAALTAVVGAERRASAYGLFDTGFGLAWMLGSAAMGLLYDRSLGALVAFSVALQLTSLPLLVLARKDLRAS